MTSQPLKRIGKIYAFSASVACIATSLFHEMLSDAGSTRERFYSIVYVTEKHTKINAIRLRQSDKTLSRQDIRQAASSFSANDFAKSGLGGLNLFDD